MERRPSKEELAAALAAAGSAHHDYEIHFLGGERDEQWPGWYAAYVLGRLGDFTSAARLSNWLGSVPSGDDWPRDAAAFVLARIDGA